ncbi:MAG: hypothetical protein O3C40_13870 [Planctomycetota bacterium]|nr:hypothetical protein [Planctomycetota bacterium]
MAEIVRSIGRKDRSRFRESSKLHTMMLDPAKLQTVTMPKGQWPSEGPASLAAYRPLQEENQ